MAARVTCRQRVSKRRDMTERMRVASRTYGLTVYRRPMAVHLDKDCTLISSYALVKSARRKEIRELAVICKLRNLDNTHYGTLRRDSEDDAKGI